MPLLFWHSVVGAFMKFLPIALIVTLSTSLLIALIFVATLATFFGKPSQTNDAVIAQLAAGETGLLEGLGSYTAKYIRLLKKLLQ